MLQLIKNWFHRYLSNEEAVILLFLLILTTIVVVYLGGILAPLLASIVIAYILQGMVARLESMGVVHTAAVTLVCLLFLSVMLAFLVIVLPLLITQTTSLVREVPGLVITLQSLVVDLPEQFPEFITVDVIQQITREVATEASRFTQSVLTYSLSSIPILVTILIYVVLVPILVFFLLKDKELILRTLGGMLPRERPMMQRIWSESNLQFSNYIRGKVVEVTIVGVVTWVSFALLGVDYAALLGLLVGLSVLVPFIGAAVATLPVAIVGLLQWGWGSEFIWLMVVYAVIQALDGNVLVPLLFSEVVNLHPLLIIGSVLFFGGIWGLWGVFFAIPLATLLKSVFMAWPQAARAA